MTLTLTSSAAMTTDDHAPIDLSTLSKWVLPNTLLWLENVEKEERASREDIEKEGLNYGAGLFDTEADREEESELQHNRVGTWITSASGSDGGFDWTENEVQNDQCPKICAGVSVIYTTSTSSEGHGNTVWASARHISNLLGNRESCRQVLSPLLRQRQRESTPATSQQKHPLFGLSFVELGAGAGVPSWTAMRCGARVVCTDQSVADRIRCIAECAERNWRDMKKTESEAVLENAKMARSCPYNWGAPIEEVTLSLDKNELFDVVIAADCCYMPFLQPKLLKSIDMLMSKEGVALVSFALHGNAPDEDVWGVVDRAKELGFCVEVLEPKQLTPSTYGMELKQGLVQTVRLTRQLC
ncbi:hypothetical protein HJC23_012070 [Cyclotella cryptica]|uniref:Calmodulin-lysine N-methyltransferase n=1 Tax=Cyclotella cryptica TaxID=29204 RepID=A0ABD3PY73_9STRA|eukprot:CCRYP_011654-RA/>CCRYP_011654-RA protein AED:0.23 eAED:0.23 QI:0/-1/0/1/-1/1/1/0/355